MNLNFGPSFVEIYDNALTNEECDILISEFEKGVKTKGKILDAHGETVVDESTKNSLELEDCLFSKANLVSSIISTRLDICLEKYKKKYSFFNEHLAPIKRFDSYTFKKFEGKGAGFKKWHHEHGPIDPISKRVLVWAFYLNDAPGTDFMFYPNISGKEGRCVIFPASFNYMHRSSPNKGIKYIITGWFSYI